MIQGALPVGAELQRRGMNSAALCPRCKLEESAEHIFFHCPFAKEVWRLIPLNVPVHLADDADIKSIMVIFRSLLCLPPTGITTPVLPWICWSLWTARNKLIFENKTAQPTEVATRGLSSALEWVQAQVPLTTSSKRSLPRNSTQRQGPNLQSTPSVFVDAAWKVSSNQAGIAWILTENLSIEPITGSLIITEVASPLMAESLALRQGISEALRLWLTSISVYSDCATLIRAISSDSQIKEIYGVLQDIKNLSSHFHSISFLHVDRSQNIAADELAKRALKASSVSSCNGSGPAL